MKKKAAPKKRGQLGLTEEQFIRDNYGILSVEEIAEHLNRSVAPINRFITENNVFSNSEEAKDYETLKQKLHGKSFWNEITHQFDETSGELEYFESTWINLMKQFREDVLAAEELQIKPSVLKKAMKTAYNADFDKHSADYEELENILTTVGKI